MGFRVSVLEVGRVGVTKYDRPPVRTRTTCHRESHKLLAEHPLCMRIPDPSRLKSLFGSLGLFHDTLRSRQAPTP